MNRCTIIQYNCGNANQGACRPFFDSVTPADHQVLAVQEPAYNKYTKSIYCPRGFTLTYDALPTTKVCFMISKNIDLAHWKRRQYGPFTAALWVRLEGLEVTIINVYNPRGDGPQIRTWPEVKTAIEEAKGEIILLGDFNAHHPIWGGKHVASEEQAERLLAETDARGLVLATPRGEPTWKRGEQESVIDLTFISQDLYRRVNFCGTVEEWALTRDHIPIRIQINNAGCPPAERQRLALRKLNI
jgi:Endonuclease-reverse transcriptase